MLYLFHYLAQCHLTKYLICMPIKDFKATTVVTALMKHLICILGVPQVRKAVSAIAEEMLRIFKINHRLNQPYSPWVNGIVECSNACVGDFIRRYCKRYSDWDVLAPFMQMV